MTDCVPSQTVGPFFHLGLCADARLARLASPEANGDHVHLRIVVLDGDGAPVPDALIELWQADAGGRYNHPRDPCAADVDVAFRGFGRLATDDHGACLFETVRPGRVRDDRGGWQAAHVNVTVFARGLLRRLVTRVYFAGDSDLGTDAVLSLVPAHRRHTLIATPVAGQPVQWSHAIRLQGEGETVFFDL